MQEEDKVRLYHKYRDKYKDMSYMLNSACHYIVKWLLRNQPFDGTNHNDDIAVVCCWKHVII